MNLILFVMIIAVSFIVVRIGAIAFELTGLESSLARFQALSCFTGTGFTTKEAELVTGNPQRRRIATVLIVLGHAGLVSMIATFANSLRPSSVMTKFTIPFLHSVIPSYLLPSINLIIIIVAVYLIYRIFTHAGFAKKLTDILKSHIIKKDIIKSVSFEELLIATGGYGISQVEIRENTPIVDKALRDSNLRENDITVLAVEREGTVTPNPSANMKMQVGDKLICFGKLENIRKELYEVPK
jgi:hypothetical protein